jgi:S-DNA-T family DNA segregation ATPase FtsK/SpoIIIE
MATIAPVLMSLVVWIVTQSAFALIFAGLGPIVAAGSFADSRIQSRRRDKKERQRFAKELHAAQRLRAELHDAEVSERDARAPSAPHLVELGARWSAVRRGLDVVTISVGRGECESFVECDSGASRNDISSYGATSEVARNAARAVAELIEAASVLDNAPLTVDVEVAGTAERYRQGSVRGVNAIAIVGSGAGALAVARSLSVQITAALPPDRFSIRAQGIGHDWGWLDELPHTLNVEAGLSSQARHVGAGRVDRYSLHDTHVEPLTIEWVSIDPDEPRGHSIRLVLARVVEALPPESDVILDARGVAEGRILEHPDARLRGPVSFETISEAQARAWARTVAATALLEGRAIRDGGIPAKVSLAELVAQFNDAGATPRASTLACEFAVDGLGPITVDLVADGPHAIVGGTTGSGKSELLISWVLALASRFGPTEFAVLLVDFKGGSSFGNLRQLPHCVGLLTDLDEATARRALDSLSAEMKHRERTLHDAGARSIDYFPELHQLPRLVIVVDEFAAMAGEHPDLHALFSDIAARGRSLGVHLILCTQRPAGVIRESVFANSGLRISLRVNNKADSIAVIDSAAAAGLPADLLGRAILVRSGSEPRAIQCAIAAPSDVDTAVAMFADAPRPRPPWLDPLPAMVSCGEVQARWKLHRDSVGNGGRNEVVEHGGTELPVGLADRPELQAQPVAVWSPHVHGHMLVIGQSRSGKSSAVRAIREAVLVSDSQADVVAPASPEAAWDAVTDALALVLSTRESARQYILLDDLDALLTRLSVDHQAEFADRLVQLLREGPARGIFCAISVHRVTSPLQQCAVLMGSRLVLSVASRQDHVMAGGDPQHFSARLSPGLGSWQGAKVQVGWSENTFDPAEPRLEGFSPAESFAVVSTSPRSFVARLSRWSEGSGTVFDVIALASADVPNFPMPASRDSQDLSIATGARPCVLIGDPETWHSQWGSLASVRSRGIVVFDGCSVSDFRALTRERNVPPPLAITSGHMWIVAPESEAARVCFEQ